MARGLPPGYEPGGPLSTFRRIPGTRRYYTAKTYAEETSTGQKFTEHFVVRRYNPSRTQEERQQIRQEAARYRGRMLRGRYRYLEAFRLKEQAEGIDPSGQLARFNALYGRYLAANHAARRVTRITTREEWNRLHGTDSELSRVLVELGMRLPDERVPVTGSPQSYWTGTMRPFFSRRL